MRITVYAQCWNEEKILPFFLKHYAFADRIVIYDNQSTDASAEIAAKDPRVTLRPWDTDGRLNTPMITHLRNTMWKELTGADDWAIVVDMDEFLYYPTGIRGLIEEHKQDSFFAATGWSCAYDGPLDIEKPLYTQITKGQRESQHKWMDKPCLFRPWDVEETNFGAGTHNATPTFKRPGLSVSRPPDFLLFHYKIFGPDFYAERSLQMASRVPGAHLTMGINCHLNKTREDHVAYYRHMMAESADIPIKLEMKK